LQSWADYAIICMGRAEEPVRKARFFMDELHRQSNIERYLMRAVAAWLMAVGIASILTPWGQTGGSAATIIVFTAVCAAFLTAAVFLSRHPQADTRLFFAAAVFVAVAHAGELDDPYFAFLAAGVLLLLGWLLAVRGRLTVRLLQISTQTANISIAVMAALLFFFLAVLTTLRYLCYYCPNFDFGIFTNMFYHMRTDLTQTVSCERDMLMSHFQVHISPIYYLMLPFYALFPSPITLQVLQAAIVAAGVIPLAILAKKRGLAPAAVVAVAAVYVLYPAFAGGCFYDLHENKFLTVLILSMVCAYETKRFGWMYLFAALTLLVKEDAAVYVAVFGLYLLVGRRAYRRGTILLIGAVAYFLFAAAMLEWFGLGVMSWRYANISDSGLVGVVWAVLTDPGRVLAECLSAEKLVFLLQMMLPLLFLPVLTKRPGRLVLLIPLVLVNLMPGYANQYSIDFQYTYGSGALLFYAAVLNLADLRERTMAMVAAGAATTALVLASAFTWPRIGIASIYRDSRETRAAIAEVLAEIPADASVTADTFLLSHLSERELIFEYPSQHQTEYVVLDLRYLYGEALAEAEAELAESGYECVCRREWAAVLYKQTETE